MNLDRRMKTLRRGTWALIAGCLPALAALAGEPAATQPAVPPAAAATAVPTISQDALLNDQKVQGDRLFVLDVRTPQEFAEGHVPGAKNISHDQLAARLGEVPRDKDVVLYCHSGRRAGLAADLLQSNGYTRLSHLEGDMQAWVANGRPIEKP